ncbi:DUF4326 domain-containing protein [Rhodococcus hoagii]|nr:DUF4326 domain-containing protein [Prescottella equi]
MPQRIQRQRTRGWRMPEGAVYVGRPSKWGNPFTVGEMAQHWHRATTHPYAFYIDRHTVGSADQAAGLFRKIVLDPSEHEFYGHETPTIEEIRAELAGRDLACWCPLDQPCHADVLLEIANGSRP